MRKFFAAAIVLLQMAAGAMAADCTLDKPKGDVILVVDGMIGACNNGSEVQLDATMIEALPRRIIKTENPWDHGLSTYEGVRLSELLGLVKAEGKMAAVSALNDYRSEVPVEDLLKYDVILADTRNGEKLPVRDKGPLFVVFPFSDYPELKTEARYAQSVWQVNRITLK